MSSGMDKPTVALKPKLPEGQRPGLSPLTPKKDSLQLPSPGTLRKVKPILAPKPCLSKLTAAVESNPVSSKNLHQTSVTENPNTQGLLNSQQGVQENKKSAWDYTIPICLCSPENCMCIGDISANKDKTENDLKDFFKGKTNENIKPLPTSRGPTDIHGEKINTRLANHNHLRETFTIDKNLNPDHNTGAVSRALLQRTWSDEANGNKIPQSASGHGPWDDSLGSEQVSRVLQHKPVPPDTRKPLPVPRKPRMAVPTHQEKVDGCLEILHQEGRYMNGTEGKVSSEGKDNDSLSVNKHVETQPVVLSERQGCTMPAAMPRKKHFLSVSAADTQTFSKDVEEEELGWDSGSKKMEMSVDKVDDEQGKEGIHDQETDCTDFTHCPHSDQQEHSPPPVIAVAAVDVPARVAPKKPQRHSSPRARMEEDGSSKEKEQQKLGDNEKRHDFPIEERISKERAMRELPLPPAEKTNKTFFTTGAIKPSRTSFNKSRAKSFSAADLICSEGPKRYSFRKLLDLKLSVKMLPKVAAKGGRNPGCSVNDTEQRIDRDQDGCDDFHKQFKPERTMSCPLITVTQSVDGDELPAGREDIYYENVPYYEEIPDYENMHVGGAKYIPCASDAQPTAWQCPEYNDEGIYEEQEPYMSFEKNPVHQQGQRSTDSERSSVDEEVTPLDGGLSNEDTLVITSNEDDDGSSNSSKGDPEQAEQRSVQSEKKQNKILHIAKEIMSSESVFVDALKLLHVDFRDEVYRASRQSGKLVIEERLLNQILYYLPQLYELNQDLLKELKLRVAKWDESAQLADIFLNKGHYLKMYSTYISSFDKNVALLEEQSKRNALFGAVVREFEASPRCASLALKHYLLKPVQRIPQYQLLLTDYLKNLTKDSSDYNDTQAALVLVKEVANHANDILKQGDNFQKLMQVQCSLTSHNEIVQPGRKFLKEGILKKLSRKVMQPRMFFLFNDILLHTIPVQSGQYKFKNMWSLAGMKVSKPSQEAYQNELNIESVERSFILSASSATERDEWLDAISTAISAFTKKKFTFASGKPVDEVELQGSEGAPLGSKAPIWIPDPRTTMCMICTCEFTLTWRRHHCRACGKVVCQNCSSNKHCLEYLKNRSERVCDQCFNVLRQQKSVKTMSAAASTGNRSTFALHRKQKKIPAALKAVTANTDSSMSGYLQRSNGKKQGKRLWFVIKDKVLYTYAASEDVAALESQPLLGFVLKMDSSASLRFQLYHKNTLYYIFKADDIQTAERWIDSFKEATVL